jgi:hypothetical protein
MHSVGRLRFFVFCSVLMGGAVSLMCAHVFASDGRHFRHLL